MSRLSGVGKGEAGVAVFHSRYLKCPLWEAGDTMWSRNECWRTNIPKRKQERWKAACCAVSRKGIPSMSWERERPFAAVADRRAHTAVNEPPSAERWHNIGKSADNSWLTSKLSVKTKDEKCCPGVRLVQNTKTKKTLQINVIYRKMYGVVKADGARTTLCLFAALLSTCLIAVISIIPFKWLPEVCWLK